jgi:3-hydroxyacyl-CoA dehydrogenase/enoyl-CoA hydratase/3-hydroxybutyryl-CoA epimerase
MTNMTDRHLSNFDLHQDGRGVMTAILNVPNSPVNVFNAHVMADLAGLIAMVEQSREVQALVFRSGKDSGFLAGADVRQIELLQSPEEARQACWIGQNLFARLENLPIPTVAVIQGTCLGGGLEFALACKARLVVNDPRTKLGLPEVELGVLPGWGGTQRLPRKIGLTQALPMLLTGKKLNARQAFEAGLADRLAEPSEVDAVLQQLLTDLLEGWRPPARPRTWKTWFLDHTWLGQQMVLRQARQSIGSKSRHYPALEAILEAVSAGLRGIGDEGFAVERQSFGQLALSSTSRHLVQLFFQREKARNASTWVSSVVEKPAAIRKVGVVGGGVMGAGIAHWCASQGLTVALKEVSPELVEQGLGRIKGLFDEGVRKGAMSSEEARFRMESIQGSAGWDGFSDVDLVIEAATEKLDLKQALFREVIHHVPWHAILTTNTSALSVTALAGAVSEPERVAGLHFFNPVHRMQLVEIVTTVHTVDSRIARLVEFVKKLGKTPVVCTDSPGFVVNRILFPYLDEAVRLVCEGVPAERIDRVIEEFGMPMGPLELLDQVGIDVAAHVARSLAGLSPQPSPTPERLQQMAAAGELGRKSGRGFYEYKKGRKKPVTSAKPSAGSAEIVTDRTIEQRTVLRLVNEAAKVMSDGVVAEPWMVDLAMVLGTGFAPHTGGPLAYADHYGVPVLLHELEQWERKAGPRFAPASWWMNHMVGSTK